LTPAHLNVVNEARVDHGGWSQIKKSYQNQNGAVNTATTPAVEYIYADSGTNYQSIYVRLREYQLPGRPQRLLPLRGDGRQRRLGAGAADPHRGQDGAWRSESR
jgi:hypothetical protein